MPHINVVDRDIQTNLSATIFDLNLRKTKHNAITISFCQYNFLGQQKSCFVYRKNYPHND